MLLVWILEPTEYVQPFCGFTMVNGVIGVEMTSNANAGLSGVDAVHKVGGLNAEEEVHTASQYVTHVHEVPGLQDNGVAALRCCFAVENSVKKLHGICTRFVERMRSRP